jgi:PAS domain S-box-containing protein
MEHQPTLPQIIDGLSVLIVVTTPEGRIELVNRHVLEYCGKSLDELKEWETSDAVHPDDLPRVLAAWRQSVQRGVPHEIEHRLRRADGVYRWFHVQALPVRDTDGRILCWFVLLTDIEGRKRAEALLAGEKRLLELIASGYALRDVLEAMSGLVETAVSNCHCSILLIDPDGTKFRPGGGSTLPGYEDMVDGALVACASGPCGTATSLKAQVIVPDLASDPRWVGHEWRTLALAHGLRAVCSTPIVSLAGMALGTFAIYQREPGHPTPLLQDLIARFTHVASIAIERANNEATLKRSEAFLAEAQRLSSTGSFWWRVVTDDITVSRESYRIWEIDPAIPFSFQVLETRIHPDDLPAFKEWVARARRDGNDAEFEHRLLMPDRAVKYLHVFAQATRNQRDELEYIGAIHDITERRRSEEALATIRSELARVARVTTLGALTASIAHEVNQPLSGIVTNAGTCLRMLAADPPNLEGARETVRRAIRDGNRAAEVIARLRSLFVKKATTTELVDLNDAAQEVLALSSHELQRSKVIVRTELADDLPRVSGDRVQLQQVMLNLVLNALEAMSTVEDRPRHLVVRTERDDADSVRVTMRDSGVGLDQQTRERLFDTFYTTKSSGMGIGLSVSRSIIEHHRGRVWAEPNDGPGATFRISLPGASEMAMPVVDNTHAYKGVALSRTSAMDREDR